jgi:ElaB/YqjD/DUF883 family membrane-anchored ribosome-binding protein
METTETTQQTGQAYQDIKEKAGQLAEKAKSTARDAGAGADLYVHEYAWTTVAIVALLAGGIGYLLGRQQS